LYQYPDCGIIAFKNAKGRIQRDGQANDIRYQKVFIQGFDFLVFSYPA
jgi:hypothetical protein